MPSKTHWEQVYQNKSADSVSWFQEHAATSLALIHQTGVAPDAAIIDVGGGASTLVDDLLNEHYEHLTVLDLSDAALQVARDRLGSQASRVHWLEADILQAPLPECHYDLWHDRAVFHFLTDEADRLRYLQVLGRAVKPGGFVIIGTFAEDGPERCSGLPVQRYDASTLHGEFGPTFQLLGHAKEAHHTPAGVVQQFLYCYCRKLS